ncbi:TetR/AcrR family transcriptional regulator [Amycolatopsis sp. CA-230715]|uniref:TetR/AcrR family transcriptional regulator n=1 Tax=Amycolatopsis sp. CA-230715 TaxID=2745196 RepID=UPI001C028D82|nr:TetR/AcrR family transcriptional regulator [Amycolatopsis sp. CA-230715]QWF80374.1 hypothetical protein HUW46_03794 [Amycolatopsis sp. CA-230715]
MSDTRTKVLDAAIELFSETGYDKASIRALGERLGVTSAALYYHFRNKQEILTALAERVCADVEALADKADAESDLETRRRLVLDGYLAIVSEHRRVMAVLEASIATLRTLDVGARSARAMDRLAAQLGAEHRVRAVAALGILTTVPVQLPSALRAPGRAQLLAAALGALEHPVP